MTYFVGALITPNSTIIPIKILESDIDYILQRDRGAIPYTQCPHIKSEGITIYFKHTPHQGLDVRKVKNSVVSSIAKRDIFGIAIITFSKEINDTVGYIQKLVHMVNENK